MWIQNFTNIDTKGNKGVVSFNHTVKQSGNEFYVVDNQQSEQPLFLIGKFNEVVGTSIGFKEKSASGVEIWINSWMRLTANPSAPSSAKEYLKALGFENINETIYINLESRKIYGRLEFLNAVIDNLNQESAYEKVEPAEKDGQPLYMVVNGVNFYNNKIISKFLWIS